MVGAPRPINEGLFEGGKTCPSSKKSPRFCLGRRLIRSTGGHGSTQRLSHSSPETFGNFGLKLSKLRICGRSENQKSPLLTGVCILLASFSLIFASRNGQVPVR